MPSPWMRLHRLVLCVGLTAAIAWACTGTVPSREWNLSAVLPGGSSFPVVVHDTSGRITKVEIDPAGVHEGGFTNPFGQPNVVLVPWTAGACDPRTEITIRTVDAGPGLVLDVRTAASVCDAIGVEHFIRLTATDAVPADRVLVGTVVP